MLIIYLSMGFFFAVTFSERLAAVTLEQLQNDPKLTPKRFASYFADFRYEFHPNVQPVEAFLGTQAGDCDDYAILADRVLRPKGFETRLIFVRMPGLVAHVVCYIGQEKGYLDFNNRIYWIKIERSGPTIREIANKVAKSFTANWTFASEFTFGEDHVKHLIRTVAKTDTGKEENGIGAASPQIKINF